MKNVFRLVMLLSAVILMSPAAYAQGAEGTGACKADVQTYCSGVQKGQGRIGRCLKEHKDSLSEGCKSAMKQRMAEHRARKQGGAGTEPTSSEGGESAAPSSEPPAAQ